MRRKLELKEIMENANLLKDMLDASEQNTAPSEDELTTMRSLYDTCKQLQPTILIILGDVEENYCLAEAVDTNEFVTDVFKMYQRLVANKPLSSDLIAPVATVPTNNCSHSTMDELNAIFASGSNQTSPATNHIAHTPLMPISPTPVTSVTPQTESNGMASVDMSDLLHSFIAFYLLLEANTNLFSHRFQ